MADKVRKPVEDTADKAKGESIDNASDAITDQTKRAQGTIDQDEDNGRNAAAAKRKVDERTDEIAGN